MLVERVDVMDVKIPENLQRAMAAEAEAARNARAKVIASSWAPRAIGMVANPVDVCVR